MLMFVNVRIKLINVQVESVSLFLIKRTQMQGINHKNKIQVFIM